MYRAAGSSHWLEYRGSPALPVEKSSSNEVVEFINTNHHNPSRHRIEEHNMLNWLMATRKKINTRELKEERLTKFKEVLALVEENKRNNQYQ